MAVASLSTCLVHVGGMVMVADTPAVMRFDTRAGDGGVGVVAASLLMCLRVGGIGGGTVVNVSMFGDVDTLSGVMRVLRRRQVVTGVVAASCVLERW